MQLLKQQTTVDLTEISEVDLVTELWNRGIDLEYIEGAFYSLGEIEGNKWDEMTGYSEEGLHGNQSDVPKKRKLPVDETGDSN